MAEDAKYIPPLAEDKSTLPRPSEFSGTSPSAWGLVDLFGGSERGYIAELMLLFAIHRNSGWEPITESALHSHTRVPETVLRTLKVGRYFVRGESPSGMTYSGFPIGGHPNIHFTAEGVRMMHRQIVGLGSLVHILPRPTCIVLDYDYTVARFHGGFNGLYELLAKHAGVPISLGKDAHEMAEAKGFTPERLLACAKELGFYLDASERVRFHEAFGQWLRESLHLYQEANDAVSQWTGVPIHIVSFGDRDYQGAKIDALCVPHSGAYIVQESKVAMLRKLHEQYGGPIWFFDDNPEEHNAVRDAVMADEQVICILVTRHESPHYKKTCRYAHRRVTSLLDVRW